VPPPHAFDSIPSFTYMFTSPTPWDCTEVRFPRAAPLNIAQPRLFLFRVLCMLACAQHTIAYIFLRFLCRYMSARCIQANNVEVRVGKIYASMNTSCHGGGVGTVAVCGVAWSGTGGWIRGLQSLPPSASASTSACVEQASSCCCQRMRLDGRARGDGI